MKHNFTAFLLSKHLPLVCTCKVVRHICSAVNLLNDFLYLYIIAFVFSQKKHARSRMSGRVCQQGKAFSPALRFGANGSTNPVGSAVGFAAWADGADDGSNEGDSVGIVEGSDEVVLSVGFTTTEVSFCIDDGRVVEFILEPGGVIEEEPGSMVYWYCWQLGGALPTANPEHTAPSAMSTDSTPPILMRNRRA